MRASSVLLVSLAALVSAEDFLVLVGENGTLAYNPTRHVSPLVNSSSALTYRLYPVSMPRRGTQYLSGSSQRTITSPSPGVDSGYMPVPADSTAFPEWTITIANDSQPLWFYCAQRGHCTGGMVFALNPTAEKTFAAFQATAMGSTSPSTTSGSGGNGGATVGGSGASEPGTATASSPSGTSGSASGGNNGALSTNVAGRSVLSIVMLVLGASIFLV
ncbi:hypothetical protein D9756_004663 [Leucocoprinus leucothites]|uniref:Extracellular serine-rich protein n=1 Tax=Leucocoprinus leucothites TaxID=201217 RepID=A0A8H5G9D0_9AGAR|nr:hypothetical protein D9756_004663 [Leucoagaricus leucothites]